MSIIQKPISEATAAEMLSFARNFLSLDLDGSENEMQIAAKVAQTQPGIDYIFVVDDEPAAEIADNAPTAAMLAGKDANARVEGSLGRDDPRVIIFIPVVQTSDKTGAADVAVAVNGRAWQLKRGVELEVPWRVVEALGLAEQDIVDMDLDTGEVLVSKSMRFPLQFPKGLPPADVIAAWHERTDNAFCP